MIHNMFELLMRSRRYRTAPGAPVGSVAVAEPRTGDALTDLTTLLAEPHDPHTTQGQRTSDRQQQRGAVTRPSDEEVGLGFSLLFS